MNLKRKIPVGIVSDEMEISADIENQKELMEESLKNIPTGEKIDIKADDIYSGYYNAELQIKLKKIYEKVNSPMRKVGDYLDVNHSKLKDKEISYKKLADELNLTESKVYSAVRNLQAYEGYSFTFHPTRKKLKGKGSFGSFRFSIDDYMGWSKENDIREKTINRKLVVHRKSQDRMYPKFRDRIKQYKIKKIKELKKRIIDRQEQVQEIFTE